MFRLHHIGMLVDSMEKAARLQVERYGYRIESEIILDPVQTAFVQFLRLPGQGHWLELVSPVPGESKLAQALERRGEHLHHLCYEVVSLSDAVDHLRQCRQLLLADPTPAEAFPGRRIAWFMDRARQLTELVEQGEGTLSLQSLEFTAKD